MIYKKIYRFIEIDIQYFKTSLPIKRKFLDIIKTNYQLFKNIILKQKPHKPVFIGNKLVNYDTPYATKTLLTTIYDFYTETKSASILPKKPLVVDIGANIGQFVVAVKSFYPQAKIYSCEPDKETFLLLEKNASGYKNVKIFNYALSDKSGSAKFYRSKEFSEWSGLAPLEGHRYEESKVTLRRGDTIFSAIGHIDLLKIDVEGAELEVLKGLKNTLKKCKYVLIEVSIQRNTSDVGSTKVLDFLFQNNFSIDHIGRIFSDYSGKFQGAVDILFKNNNYE